MKYFGFTHKVLVDFMFMNFITVIGSYHAKNDSLKAWIQIPFLDEDEKNVAMEKLKEIRARYADARNNLICHINDEIQNCTSVLTKQITDDINTLRNIFNTIRRNNNIPIIITPYLPSDHYPVVGLNKIISVLIDKSNTDVA